jgi:hypothetical protein
MSHGSTVRRGEKEGTQEEKKKNEKEINRNRFDKN